MLPELKNLRHLQFYLLMHDIHKKREIRHDNSLSCRLDFAKVPLGFFDFSPLYIVGNLQKYYALGLSYATWGHMGSHGDNNAQQCPHRVAFTHLSHLLPAPAQDPTFLLSPQDTQNAVAPDGA